MKIVYIAHPIGGNVAENRERIKAIGRQIIAEERDTMPFAPYFFDLEILDDGKQEERDRGLRHGLELIRRKFIDEVRLYGDRISSGMKDEILAAIGSNVKVVPMTPETREAFKAMIRYDIGSINVDYTSTLV